MILSETLKMAPDQRSIGRHLAAEVKSIRMRSSFPEPRARGSPTPEEGLLLFGRGKLAHAYKACCAGAELAAGFRVELRRGAEPQDLHMRKSQCCSGAARDCATRTRMHAGLFEGGAGSGGR